jgi:chromate transporter
LELNIYLKIFLTFFKIGATTFGGGYAMLPIIRREVVEKHGWIDGEEFVDVLAVAQSSPGAVAINSAVFVGTKLKGVPGAFAALMGSVLPSFIVILTIAVFFTRYTEYPAVIAAFAGIRPAVAALFAAAVIKVGKPALKKPESIIYALGFLALSAGFGVHPFVVILLGCATGLLATFLAMRGEKEGERQ